MTLDTFSVRGLSGVVLGHPQTDRTVVEGSRIHQAVITCDEILHRIRSGELFLTFISDAFVFHLKTYKKGRV